MVHRYENPHKQYVKVRADFDFDGRIIPVMFRAEDGPVVKIDRVLDICKMASTKAGGQGIRYLCRIQDKEVALFHDRDEWFIEI